MKKISISEPCKVQQSNQTLYVTIKKKYAEKVNLKAGDLVLVDLTILDLEKIK